MRRLGAALLLVACRGSASQPGPTTTTSPAAPTAPLCRYAGDLEGVSLLTPRGTPFAWVGHMPGLAAFDSTRRGEPRLRVDIATATVRLRGDADLTDDSALRVVRPTSLAPGVVARQGATPRVIDVGPGEVVIGLPPDTFSDVAGWRFATPPEQRVGCDALMPRRPADDADATADDDELHREGTPRRLRAGRTYVLRQEPDGPPVAEVSPIAPGPDADADAGPPGLDVIELARGRDGAWMQVRVDDGAFAIIGWLPADQVSALVEPEPSRYFGSLTGRSWPQQRCTADQPLPISLLEEDGTLSAIGELPAGQRFDVQGQNPLASRLLITPLTEGLEAVGDWVVTPSTPPTCEPLPTP